MLFKKMKKKALILGITGQDGSYLAEFLLKKNYQVHGIKRRTSTPNTSRIDHIFDSINFDNKNQKWLEGDRPYFHDFLVEHLKEVKVENFY